MDEIIKNIIQNINPWKLSWDNIDDTNCYAWALGIDLSSQELEEKSNIDVYNVGAISNNYCSIQTNDELIYALKEDLKILSINIEEVNIDYELNKKEWKIALFNTKPYYECGLFMTDFHFLKQIDNFNWSHKNGYFKKISFLDSENNIINNPVTAKIYVDGNKEIKYDYVATYKLNLK